MAYVLSAYYCTNTSLTHSVCAKNGRANGQIYSRRWRRLRCGHMRKSPFRNKLNGLLTTAAFFEQLIDLHILLNTAIDSREDEEPDATSRDPLTKRHHQEGSHKKTAFHIINSLMPLALNCPARNLVPHSTNSCTAYPPVFTHINLFPSFSIWHHPETFFPVIISPIFYDQQQVEAATASPLPPPLLTVNLSVSAHILFNWRLTGIKSTHVRMVIDSSCRCCHPHITFHSH